MWTLLRGLWRDATESLSTVVVTACVVVFAILAVLDSTGIVSRGNMLAIFGLSYYGLVKHYWLFEFLTSPFVHANLQHLVFNMLSLWFLGPLVENALGRRRYVVFSAVCAISASVGFLLFDHGMGLIVMGYSGVIFGLLTAHAVIFPDELIHVMFFFSMKMRYAAILWGATELYFSIAGQADGIAHCAHLFGILGAILTLLATRTWRLTRPRQGIRLRASGRRAQNISVQKPSPQSPIVSSVSWGAIHDHPVSIKSRQEYVSNDHNRLIQTFLNKINAGFGARKSSSSVRPWGKKPADIDRKNMDQHRMAVSCSLIVVAGASRGRSLALESKSMIIGRSADADLSLGEDGMVSRKHARVNQDASGQYVMEDAGSRHGVYINGRRVTRYVMAAGDRIRIGCTELIFVNSAVE